MSILGRAELLLQAKNYSGTGDWLDESGNGHDAQLGSAAGADTNDPEYLAHSGENYVRLPGAAGNFVDTPDVNLLDADTAHLHQSIGLWAGQGAGLPTWGTGTPGFFGDGSVVVTSASSGQNRIHPSTLVTVAASTEYTVAAYVGDISTDDGQIYLGVDYYNGAVKGAWSGTQTAITATEGWIEHTFTVPASHDGVDIWMFSTAAAANEQWWVGGAVLRAGSDGTFVPSLRIVGDLDIRAKLAADDWTAAANWYVLDCGNLATTGYLWLVDSSGTHYLYWGDGSALKSETTTAYNGLTNGNVNELRITRDASTGNVVWYLDGVSADTDTSTPSAIGAGASGLTVGANDAGTSPFAGDLYFVEVRDGIDGPVVARYSAEDAAEPFATQVGAVDGRTWTYNRSGSGLYVVDRPSFGLHTDDEFRVEDAAGLNFGAADSMTVLVVARLQDRTAGTSYLAYKHSVAPLWGTYVTAAGAASFIVNGGTATSAGQGTVANRETAVLGFRRDIANAEIQAFLDGVGGTAVTDPKEDLSDPDYLSIGSYGGGGYSKLEVMAVALFREALTDDEIVQAGAALTPGGSNLLLLGVA